MKDLKAWVKETGDGDTIVFRAPTTNATISVDEAGVMPLGNFRNLTSAEADELIPVLENVLELHKQFQGELEKRRKATAASVQANAGAVKPGTPKEDKPTS